MTPTNQDDRYLYTAECVGTQGQIYNKRKPVAYATGFQQVSVFGLKKALSAFGSAPLPRRRTPLARRTVPDPFLIPQQTPEGRQ